MQKTLRTQVFFPPFILLVMGTLTSILYKDAFLLHATRIHQNVLTVLGPMYSGVAFMMVVACVVVFFSPLATVRIGGEHAKPSLTRWQWFTISLCSTVACGLLFWGTAEPVLHYFQPPQTLSQPSLIFSLASLILHWTFTPYAIYTVPALVFALNFHNLNTEMSFASCLYPLFGLKTCKRLNSWVDCLCLYSLAIGMASSLAAGSLILWGGLNQLCAVPKNAWTLALITALIVIAFIGAATSGVLKGIKVLADWNVKLFMGLILYVACCVPFADIVHLSGQSLVYYVHHFFELSLWPNLHPQDPWGYQWGSFYWAVWMSWAPMTALFLGKIAKGYTVREFIVMNFVVPALFSFIWISLFGGFALTFSSLESLYSSLLSNGPESLIYVLMRTLPFSSVLIAFFVVTCFLSFVTAADSSTVAMADISSIADEHSSEKKRLKMVWGVVLGLIAFLTIIYAGIDGIKMLGNFSGIPALLILFFVLLSLVKWNFVYARGMQTLATKPS